LSRRAPTWRVETRFSVASEGGLTAAFTNIEIVGGA
jgi:hypothetical protein